MLFKAAAISAALAASALAAPITQTQAGDLQARNIFDDARKFGHDVSTSTGATLDVAGDIGHGAISGARAVGHGAAFIGNGAVNVAEGTTHGVERVAQALHVREPDFFGGLRKLGSDVGDSLGATLNVAGDIGHGAVSGVRAVGNGAAFVGNGVVNGAEDVTNGARRLLHIREPDFFSGVRKLGSDVGDSLGATLNVAGDIGHGAVSGVRAVGHGAAFVGNGAVNVAEGTTHGVERVAQALHIREPDFFGGLRKLGSDVGDSLGATLNVAGDIGHGAVSGVRAVGHGAAFVGNGVVDGAQATVNGAKFVGGKIEQGFRAL